MTGKLHILIAEDDMEDRLIMSQTFEELHYDEAVKYVEDGTMVLKHLHDEGVNNIGLIVLDLNMPKLNGTETLRMLKADERFQHIPVVIFSTSVNEIEKNICMDLGAADYITKPSKYKQYLDICTRFYNMAKGIAQVS